MFERKLTKMIRDLEVSAKGQENPAIVDVLKELDKELSSIKKQK